MSFPCVLKRRVFVINSLFYDACFAEKSQDLIFPQESISFDSIGFYNTFCFTSLRGGDFVPEEEALFASWLIQRGSVEVTWKFRPSHLPWWWLTSYTLLFGMPIVLAVAVASHNLVPRVAGNNRYALPIL